MSHSPKISSGDYVVYPSQGVGRVRSIECQEVAGCQLNVFVIEFDKNRMVLRLPVEKAKGSGLRPLASAEDIDEAYNAFATKHRVKKAVWSRRAQEYELKINSGSLKSMAEVLRELYKDELEQSYSERQLYHLALERMCLEISLVKNASEEEVVQEIEGRLRSA